MSDLVKRLRATLEYDAINGDAHERIVATRQMREAADRIEQLERIARNSFEDGAKSMKERAYAIVESCHVDGTEYMGSMHRLIEELPLIEEVPSERIQELRERFRSLMTKRLCDNCDGTGLLRNMQRCNKCEGETLLRSGNFEKLAKFVERDLFPILETQSAEIERLTARLAEAEKALRTMVEFADEAHRAWDSDNDSRAGKMLRAMAGGMPGYRPETDKVHEFLATLNIGDTD